MLLLRAAQHHVNESWVMANAGSRVLGVPRAIPGCDCVPLAVTAASSLVWGLSRTHGLCGDVHVSPATRWTWRDEGLAGLGLLEWGHLLLRDVSSLGTSSSQGHLPGDENFSVLSSSQG